MIELRDAGKRYAGRDIITAATLKVKPGDIVCLSGPSGVGKTTLLEMMAGIIQPDTGSVLRNVSASLSFQDDALIPWLTARDNILYILSPDIPVDQAERRALYWLQRFELEADQYPSAMSGGMRRRFSLARAFAAARPLLLLDEPFAFLDEGRQRLVVEEIAAHAASSGAVVLSSHMAAPLKDLPYRSIVVQKTPVTFSLHEQEHGE